MCFDYWIYIFFVFENNKKQFRLSFYFVTIKLTSKTYFEIKRVFSLIVTSC